MLKIHWRNQMAASVAMEIDRLSAGIQPDYSQGAAYKAEWDRRGSNALTLCRDAGRDAARMGGLAHLTAASLTGGPGVTAERFALIEAARA